MEINARFLKINYITAQCRNPSGKWDHVQLVRKQSSTVVSACWAFGADPWPKGWIWCTRADLCFKKQEEKKDKSTGMVWFVRPCLQGKRHHHLIIKITTRTGNYHHPETTLCYWQVVKIQVLAAIIIAIFPEFSSRTPPPPPTPTKNKLPPTHPQNIGHR